MARRNRARRNGEGVEEALEELRNDMSALQEDVSRLFGDMGTMGSAATRGVTETVGDYAGEVGAYGEQTVGFLRETIRALPLTSMAISVGAGALLGALLARPE